MSTPKELKHVRIYDNGGKSYDRFTAVYMQRPERAQYGGFGRPLIRTYEARGMSEHPFHPQGFGMYCSAVPGRHLGKRIAFEDLPPDCQRIVLQDLN